MKNWIPTRKEGRRRDIVRSASLTALLAVLAFVAIPYTEKLLVRGALYLIDPLWQAKREALLPSPGFGALFAEKARLIQERDALIARFAAFNAVTLERDQLKRDNALLRGIKEAYPHALPLILPVIAYPNQSLYDTLIVDLTGAPDAESRLRNFVYTNGVVIGTLTSAEENIGKVTLLSTSGNLTNAQVGSSNIGSALTGKGGGSFTMSIPFDAEVAVGDVAFIPLAQGAAGAIVSTVERIESAQESRLRLRTPVNIYSLRFVELRP